MMITKYSIHYNYIACIIVNQDTVQYEIYLKYQNVATIQGVVGSQRWSSVRVEPTGGEPGDGPTGGEPFGGARVQGARDVGGRTGCTRCGARTGTHGNPVDLVRCRSRIGRKL